MRFSIGMALSIMARPARRCWSFRLQVPHRHSMTMKARQHTTVEDVGMSDGRFPGAEVGDGPPPKGCLIADMVG